MYQVFFQFSRTTLLWVCRWTRQKVAVPHDCYDRGRSNRFESNTSPCSWRKSLHFRYSIHREPWNRLGKRRFLVPWEINLLGIAWSEIRVTMLSLIFSEDSLLILLLGSNFECDGFPRRLPAVYLQFAILLRIRWKDEMHTTHSVYFLLAANWIQKKNHRNEIFILELISTSNKHSITLLLPHVLIETWVGSSVSF